MSQSPKALLLAVSVILENKERKKEKTTSLLEEVSKTTALSEEFAKTTFPFKDVTKISHCRPASEILKRPTGFRRAPLRSGQIFDILLLIGCRIGKKKLPLEFPAVFE